MGARVHRQRNVIALIFPCDDSDGDWKNGWPDARRTHCFNLLWSAWLDWSQHSVLLLPVAYPCRVLNAIAFRTNAALTIGQFNATPRFDAAQAGILPRQ